MRTYDDSETRRGERKPIRALDVRSGDEDKSERRQRRCMEEEKDVRVRWSPVRVAFMQLGGNKLIERLGLGANSYGTGRRWASRAIAGATACARSLCSLTMTNTTQTLQITSNKKQATLALVDGIFSVKNNSRSSYSSPQFNLVYSQLTGLKSRSMSKTERSCTTRIMGGMFSCFVSGHRACSGEREEDKDI